jgi:gluconolactonase
VSADHGARQSGRFDCLAVDASGNICVATLINGGFTAIALSGALIDVVPMPDRSTTNSCFGGPSPKTAWVTLSQSGGWSPWTGPG